MQKNDLIDAGVVIAVMAAVAIFFASLFVFVKLWSGQFNPTPQPTGYACTLEAKVCPDGSYVGRTGPRCEFTPCPGETPAPTSIPQGECAVDSDCPSGYVCIQSCGPPVVRVGDPPPSYYCETKENASKPRMCPICLSSDTSISTPSGPMNVKDIAPGRAVWSVNENGNKVPSSVLKVSRTKVPTTYDIIHLVLADGREARLSPGHPTISGRPVSELRAGDIYDGSKVVSSETEPYSDGYTYDILPGTSTGYYWADGILFGSTLK